LNEDKIKKPKTKREKAFFRELVKKNVKTAKEAAIKAGYSPKCAKVVACRNITKYNSYLQEVLDKKGLNELKIASKIEEGLEAKKIHGTSDDFIDIPDYQTQHKFLDTLCKLRGDFKEEKKEEQKTNIINVFVGLGAKIDEYYGRIVEAETTEVTDN